MFKGKWQGSDNSELEVFGEPDYYNMVLKHQNEPELKDTVSIYIHSDKMSATITQSKMFGNNRFIQIGSNDEFTIKGDLKHKTVVYRRKK